LLRVVPKVKEWERWIKAIDNVHKRATYYYKWVPRVWSVEFRNLLFENLNRQRFSYMYSPYNPGYAEWKMQKVGHLDFWKLEGYVAIWLKSEKVASEPGKAAWFAGLGPEAMTAEGERVAEYATLMEQGGPLPNGKFMPSRPLFGPTHTEFIQNNSQVVMKKAWKGMKDQWK
jgi:hypothetical protein